MTLSSEPVIQDATLLAGFETDSAERAIAEEFIQTLGDRLDMPIFVKDRNSVFVGCNRAFAEILELPVDAIVGRRDTDLSPNKVETSNYVRWDQRVIESGTSAIGIKEPLRLTNGSIRWLQTDKYPLRVGSGPVIGVVGCIRDVTELVNTEHELHRKVAMLERQLEERTDELELASLSLRREMRHRERVETTEREQAELVEVLEQTAASVQEDSNVESLDPSVAAVKRLLSVDLVILLTFDDEGEPPRQVRFDSEDGYTSEDGDGLDALLAWLTGSGGPGDFNGDTCAVPKGLWLGPAGSAIASAMVVGGRRVGYIVAESRGGYLTSTFATLRLASIAKQAAAFISGIRAADRAARVAAHRERDRLARDLHDTVSQAVSAIALLSETALEVSQPGNPLVELIERMHDASLSAQVEMRSLLLDMRDDQLSKACLIELLDTATSVFASRSNMKMTTTFTPIQLSSDDTVATYRIVQEALHNIGRHSNASEVTVRVTAEPRAVMVQDDGDGFDTADSVSGHFGLSIMKERAESIGASLVVTSVPGLGTDVVLTFPERGIAEVGA